MSTFTHQLGRFYSPVRGLAAVGVHGDRQIINFFTTVKTQTLQEFVARVRMGTGNSVFWDYGTLLESDYQRVSGYGKAFITKMNDILRHQLGEQCVISRL